MNNALIVLAGSTGNLGPRIARALVKKNAKVRALVRTQSSAEKLAPLKQLGLEITEVDFNSVDDLARACAGATCVVSAVSGLRKVIVDLQKNLLAGAVKANVGRFIPSDFAIDFTKLPVGSNRNLDLRREFQQHIDQAPIAVTSILNGAFTDMLTGQAPIVLFKMKRVLYWGNPDQKMDFTTMDDAAEFTASAALEESTPRYLRIAGDEVTHRELAQIMKELSEENYRLTSAGPLGVLGALTKITKWMMPTTEELYPPWQGMQYLHNMYSGLPKFEMLDNDRYGKRSWATARDILSKECLSRENKPK